MCGSSIRLQGDDSAERVGSFIVSGSFREGGRQIVMGIDIRRVDCDGPFIAGDCFFEATGVFENNSQVVMRLRRFGSIESAVR